MKILFVSHQASYTGAPINLLTFLKWMAKNTNHKIRTIIIKDGELSREFKQCGKTSVLEKKRKGKIEMMMLGLDELFPRIRQHINGIKIKILTINYSPDIVYVNTIGSLRALPYIENLKKAFVICHIHEMQYAFSSYMSKSEFDSFKGSIDKYIVPSRTTGNELAEYFLIDRNCIEVIPEHININIPPLPFKKVLDELKIQENTFIVMGAGLISWRKAPEIFIMVAREVARLSNQKVKFIWLGELYPPYYKCLIHDVEKLELSGIVEFVGPVKNITDYYRVADVFLLTSREDPYPLVCLEAASQGVPVICFDKSGGMQEFVKDDAGCVVPYLDIKAAAEKIIELINDPELKTKLGNKAQQRVREESDINVTGPKIIDIFEKLINQKP